MGRVDAAKWAAALAALPAPGPVAVSERHVHTAACWGDEIITDSIEGPGRVCEDTARYPTSYSDEGVLGRWDRWVWYPLAIVERYWDGVS